MKLILKYWYVLLISILLSYPCIIIGLMSAAFLGAFGVDEQVIDIVVIAIMTIIVDIPFIILGFILKDNEELKWRGVLLLNCISMVLSFLLIKIAIYVIFE